MEKARVAFHHYLSYGANYLLMVCYYLIYTFFSLVFFLVYVANLVLFLYHILTQGDESQKNV